jgi:hypothetical protein
MYNKSGINMNVNKLCRQSGSIDHNEAYMLVVRKDNTISKLTNEEWLQQIHPSSDWVLVGDYDDAQLAWRVDMASTSTIKDLMREINTNLIMPAPNWYPSYNGLRYCKNKTFDDDKPAFQIQWLNN